MDSPLFHFELFDLAQVQAWGEEGAQRLHWFGLSDGWSWMQAGDARLFELAEGGDEPRFVDYQVARLWEDVLELVPAILAPMPPDFGARLLPEAEPLRWSRSAAVREYWQAGTWLQARRLTSGHLSQPPRIWMWTVGDESHLAWDNRGLDGEGRPLWSSQTGHLVMPRAQLIAELRDFDRRFMAAMAARVSTIAAGGWPRPAVQIDIPQLVAEHADRQTWLERALLAAERRAEDWDAIRTAVRRVDDKLATQP